MYQVWNRRIKGNGMKRSLRMKKVFVLICIISSTTFGCGGGGDSSPEPGAGCADGIAGNYTLTYNDCPACYAYPGRWTGTFAIEQTGDNLRFEDDDGSTLFFTGDIDASCVVNTAAAYNSAQYYCEGNWTNGELELICDYLADCTKIDSYVDGKCTQRSTLQ